MEEKIVATNTGMLSYQNNCKTLPIHQFHNTSTNTIFCTKLSVNNLKNENIDSVLFPFSKVLTTLSDHFPSKLNKGDFLSK